MVENVHALTVGEADIEPRSQGRIYEYTPVLGAAGAGRQLPRLEHFLHVLVAPCNDEHRGIGPQRRERPGQLFVRALLASDDESHGHDLARDTGFANDRGGLGAGARARHHDDEIGGGDFLDQRLGAPGKIAQPGLHGPAFATGRILEFESGEEIRPLPGRSGDPLDHALAHFVEGDDLDDPRLGIGIIDAEPRLGGRAHAGAFAFHFIVLFAGGLRYAHPVEKGKAMKILCSNGVKSVMLEILPACERKSGTKIDTVWGSTMGLQQDIAAGADGDLAVLTAQVIDDHIRAGKAAAGSRVDLARSGIGVAVRKGAAKPDIASPEALKRALLAARSVSHSKTGQSGIYFPTVLAKLGISDAMQSKLVVPQGGTPIGEVVARGEAEIGIQQISELLPVPGIEIVGPLPDPLQKITVFSAGVLASAQDAAGAKDLLAFIAQASRPLLQAKGLEAPEPGLSAAKCGNSRMALRSVRATNNFTA